MPNNADVELYMNTVEQEKQDTEGHIPCASTSPKYKSRAASLLSAGSVEPLPCGRGDPNTLECWPGLPFRWLLGTGSVAF